MWLMIEVRVSQAHSQSVFSNTSTFIQKLEIPSSFFSYLYYLLIFSLICYKAKTEGKLKPTIRVYITFIQL